MATTVYETEICLCKRPLLMAGVNRYPDAKADYDHQLTEKIERASLLNKGTLIWTIVEYAALTDIAS